MAKLTEEELLFRKVEEKVKKAIFEYGLIVDGDRILIGLSGGKDSLALVDLLGRRSKIFRPRFEVIVTHIVMSNIPYRSDIDYLKSRADEHGLSFSCMRRASTLRPIPASLLVSFVLGRGGKPCSILQRGMVATRLPSGIIRTIFSKPF